MFSKKVKSEGLSHISYILGDGDRAVIAASILKEHGLKHVKDNLGSMKVCENIGCSVQKGRSI